MNLLPLLLVSALLHLYIGARLVPGLAALPVGQLVLMGGLVLSALSMPLGLMAQRVARLPLAHVLTWVGLLFMGLFSSLLVLTLARDAALLAAWLADLLVPSLLPLALLRTASAEVVPVLGLVVTLLGF
ncbi:hypothetical protein LP416_14095 [Polaromonas sp. P2-4]|nr:hypothetical protein LP416_14095 [Polaromonas sp. P2-4]